MASFYSKRYVDRAIQTDSDSTRILAQPLSQDDILTPNTSFSGSLAEEQTTQQGSTDGQTQLGDRDRAYTQSQTSESSTVDVAVVSSRPVSKQSEIGSGRPSGQTSPKKRIASLPNIADIGGIAVRLEKQARVVSMPERNCHGKLEHSRVEKADTSISTDISYYSAGSGKEFTPQEAGTKRIYPIDLPQTPSPPSSPESVMIIANESQVSGSFLRRSTDEDGWITWASSPPRPIPALHGPLSLPYARCPSGAEGTLIEGDDLSSQIWGLGIQDDVQGQNTWVAKTPVDQVLRQHGSQNPSSAMQQPISHPDCSQASFQHGRDVIIDLSKPLTFQNHADFSGVPRSYAYDLNRQPHPQTFVPAASRTVLPEIPARRNSHGRCFNTPTPHNVQHIKPLGHGLRANETFSTPQGLGLNWNGGFSSFDSANSGRSSGLNHDPRSRLNTAAPVFIPGQTNRSNITPGSALMHTANGSGSLSLARQRDGLSRPAVVPQLHRSPHTYNPPTPSTASPRWPPVFLPQSRDYDNKNSTITRHSQQSAMHHAPKVYSPQLDMDDYANRLCLMMEQLRGDAYNYNTPRSMHDKPLSQKSTPAAQIRSRALVGRGVASYEPTEAAHAPLDISSTAHEPTLDQVIQPVDHFTEDLPFSSERRRNLSYQHPRSIPLARLIQRRLSSVVEEDTVRDSLLPLLRKRGSELPARALERDHSYSQGTDGEKVEDRNVVDLESKIESAVSAEGPPMCSGGSSAVVNLPKKTTAAYPAGGLMKSHKSQKNNAGSRKENMGTLNTYITESAEQGKQKSRQRKGDTVPLRQATNPTLS